MDHSLASPTCNFTHTSNRLDPCPWTPWFRQIPFRGKTPLTLGQRYFHYLHHKYFECNYGGDGTVPMDKWFGSFHDGTEEGHELMKQRRKKLMD